MPIVPISTIRRTACGRATASDSATAPPIELPITSTWSAPSASSRLSACAVQAARPKVRGAPVAVPPKPSWSGASTRRPAASAGITGRQLAAALTPGPEPCSSSAAAGVHQVRGRVHRDLPEPGQVDGQAAIGHRLAGHVVPAAANRGSEAELVRDADRGHDVGGAGAAQDQPGMLVDHRVSTPGGRPGTPDAPGR